MKVFGCQNGGILASAHIKTEIFIEVYNNIKNNNHKLALENWKKIYPAVPLLFQEPNPTPIKYYLHKSELISSSEVRLPLTEISDNLKACLDKILF